MKEREIRRRISDKRTDDATNMGGHSRHQEPDLMIVKKIRVRVCVK